MKKIASIFLLMVMCFGVSAQSTMPTTEVRNLKGQKVPFNMIFEPGKVTLVSFWATWCIPCKKEIKNIKDQMPEWLKQVDFNYMTISEDDSRATATVKSFVAAQRWEFPTYLDPNNDLKRSLNFQNIPYTIIVDGDGKIIYQHQGYEEGAEQELFNKILEASIPIQEAEGVREATGDVEIKSTEEATMITEAVAEDAVEVAPVNEPIRQAPEKPEDKAKTKVKKAEAKSDLIEISENPNTSKVSVENK